MKNLYIYGYLPFITIVLFSLSFGVYTVTEVLELFKEIGIYVGMREFLTDLQLRLFLLILFSLSYFMLFSALKLIAGTIHEVAMLFFSKDMSGESLRDVRSGNIIYFFGSLASIAGIQSIYVLVAIFVVTTFIYFVYVVFKLSSYMNLVSTLGLVIIEIIIWSIFISLLLYIMLKLYNGLMASLPFLEENKSS